MCCVVGSALIIAIAWCVRAFKSRVLGQPPARPEAWRLDTALPSTAARTSARTARPTVGGPGSGSDIPHATSASPRSNQVR